MNHKTMAGTGKRWKASELRKLPAEQRDAILEAAAIQAEEDYRNDPELTLKQARFPRPGRVDRSAGGGGSSLARPSGGRSVTSSCGRSHEPCSFLRGRARGRHGSAHPHADFNAGCLSSAAGLSTGTRSAGAGSTPAAGTPTAARPVSPDSGYGQRRSRKS
jgi:hypothetical protein